MIKKRSVVCSTEHLNSVLSNVQTAEDEILLQSDQYTQIGCDLRDLKKLQETLSRVVDLETSRFLFVAEVSITYMDMMSTDALIQWASGLTDGRSFPSHMYN
jgi:tRNA wybutosine-synthesizing protein 4